MKHFNTHRHLPSYIVFTVALAMLVTFGVAAATDTTVTDEPPPREPPPEAERSASGLASLVLVEGTGDVKPDANDFVTLYYTGWSPAGEKFDTNVGIRPARVSIEKVSPGWQEGLRQMVAGEKRRLWIPAHLAPPDPNLGPAGDVIFDVEVLVVHSVPSPPENVTQPPKDAERTRFGAATQLIEPGEGEVRGEAGTGALVHYTVWTEDGKVLDSSLPRRRPTLFLWGKVLPAFADVLKSMTEGEKRLIWIPEGAVNRQWPGSPRGALTFEAELVKIMEKEILTPIPENAKKIPPPQGE